jgi:hypothetical protein
LRQRQHGWQHYVTRKGVGKFAGGFVLLGVQPLSLKQMANVAQPCLRAELSAWHEAP